MKATQSSDVRTAASLYLHRGVLPFVRIAQEPRRSLIRLRTSDNERIVRGQTESPTIQHPKPGGGGCDR